MTAVILLVHGSPDPRAALAARSLAASLQESFGSKVRAAFLQHDDDTLAAVTSSIATTGSRRIVVVPTLLSDAFHARVDVPAELAAAQAATGLRLLPSAPIGPDPVLLRAMDRELPPGPRLLAAAGTTDSSAQQRLRELAVRWRALSGYPTALGFAAQAEPDVPTALAQLEGESGVRASIGAFVLFPGVLPDRILAAAGDRTVSGPLANSQEVRRLVEARVHQTLQQAA